MGDNHKINTMKKSLTLDFNQAKKGSLCLPAGNSVLSSPDLNMLKVGTPELEKMILANGIGNTPTPSTASGLIFSRTVAEDPETFASGFVNALNDLHNANTSQVSDNSSGASVYTDLEQSSVVFLPVIKEEPQTVPNMNCSSPLMSPVDMEAQERIKLERKRQRNRVAASKCRTRKLECISRLEDKVKHLKNENDELASIVNQLKDHVGLLKVEVMDHVHAGCQIMF